MKPASMRGAPSGSASGSSEGIAAVICGGAIAYDPGGGAEMYCWDACGCGGGGGGADPYCSDACGGGGGAACGGGGGSDRAGGGRLPLRICAAAACAAAR